MKRFLFCAVLLLCGQPYWSAFAHSRADNPAASPSPIAAYDVPSFAAELHRLSGLLGHNPSRKEMPAFRDSLPNRCNVLTPPHPYSVSNEFLRDQLTPCSAETTNAWGDRLRKEVQSY